MHLAAGIGFLKERGLNLAAVLDSAFLPDQVKQPIQESGVPLDDYRRLVLIGNGGRRMWEALLENGAETADPVDHYSISLTRDFIRDYLRDASVFGLYPVADGLVPLQRLGEIAGWGVSSPLGIGINPTYGLWFAYRAAFLIDAELPLVRDAPASSPCDTCVTGPCISVCPAKAVSSDSFDVDSCAHYRLHPQSRCADRCLARLACPISREHRYTLPQIQYHYGRSLETLRAWYKK